MLEFLITVHYNEEEERLDGWRSLYYSMKAHKTDRVNITVMTGVLGCRHERNDSIRLAEVEEICTREGWI